MKKLKKDDQAAEFLQEATLLSNLNHPNIVRFLGIYNSEADYYIVTEFCSRGSLNFLLQQHVENLDAVDLMKIVLQAAAGMEYLEERNIVHRGK